MAVRRTLSAALLCTAVNFWTIASGLATTSCDIYQWDQLGSPGVFELTCFSFPLEVFRIFSRCSAVQNLPAAMMEVPVDVDTLCLELLSKTLPQGSFSRFQNLTRLYLYGTFYASAGAFDGIASLRHLGMQGREAAHGKIISLDDEVFEGLENLTRLDLRAVSVYTTRQQTLFKPLKGIQTISLSDNNASRISILTTMMASLASLQVLEIRRNGITEARETDCIVEGNLTQRHRPRGTPAFAPRITILDLSGNNLRKAEERALCNFPHLTVFRADGNNFNVMELLGSGIISIEALSLNNMKTKGYRVLTNVCKVASQLSVRNLTVTHNKISRIPVESLKGCSELRSLNLSNNQLETFPSDVARTMLNLRSLVLCSNKIDHLDLCPPEPRPDVLPNLTHLDVSSNRLTAIGPRCLSCLRSLVTLDLSKNHIVTLDKESFTELEKLESLNLDFNVLFLLEIFYFNHLTNVRRLGLWGNTLTHDNYSLIGMNSLQERSLSFVVIGVLRVLQNPLTRLTLEGPQIALKCMENCSSLEVLHIKSPDIYILSPFKFVRVLHIEENQVLQDRSGLVFQSFTSVERLYYSSSADMISFKKSSPLNDSLSHLRYLRHLHLKNLNLDIKMGFLTPQELFWNLTGLRTLILEDSGIEHFTATMFRDLLSLELLILKSQSVKTLQEGLLEHARSLRYIYLKDVHLDCSCDHDWLRRWLATHPEVRVPKLGAQACSIVTQQLNYLHFLEKDCSLQYGYFLFISTFSFHTFFLLTALLYHRARWYLLYLFYMLRTWWNYRGRRDGQKCYDFDVFVSYSSCDEAWVVREFLPNLEGKGPPFFKVCLHSRDFEVGKDIMDNIMDSIYRSRWTVCLVSRHYLRSHWCSLEVRMATYRLLVERKDLLVMVFLEKVSMKTLSRYHQLAKLVKKKTYLEWEEDAGQQPLFWARLRKAIGDDGAEERDVPVN